jgi:carbonic anhydrase/acetyltransferase-like protein (isoleucine patch superfamily)
VALTAPDSFRTAGPPPLLLSAGGRRPRVDSTAFIGAGSILIGDVVIEGDANVWFGVILRADLGRIVVGAGSNVQDGSVAHADDDGMVLGANVTVGHRCLLHGGVVGDGSLIGMGATLLGGAQVGRRCIVGAGALVTERFVIPDGTKAWGMPATQRGDVTPEEEAWVLHVAAACRAETTTFGS